MPSAGPLKASFIVSRTQETLLREGVIAQWSHRNFTVQISVT